MYIRNVHEDHNMNEAGERAHHTQHTEPAWNTVIKLLFIWFASGPYHDIMSDVFALKQLVNIKLHVIKIKCFNWFLDDQCCVQIFYTQAYKQR